MEFMCLTVKRRLPRDEGAHLGKLAFLRGQLSEDLNGCLHTVNTRDLKSWSCPTHYWYPSYDAQQSSCCDRPSLEYAAVHSRIFVSTDLVNDVMH